MSGAIQLVSFRDFKIFQSFYASVAFSFKKIRVLSAPWIAIEKGLKTIAALEADKTRIFTSLIATLNKKILGEHADPPFLKKSEVSRWSFGDEPLGSVLSPCFKRFWERFGS